MLPSHPDVYDRLMSQTHKHMKSNRTKLARRAEVDKLQKPLTVHQQGHENSRSVNFGEFLQVMITQILKKKSKLGVTPSRAISDCEARKTPSSILTSVSTYYESGAVDRILHNNFVAA